MHCASDLTTKGKNTSKNQNGISMIQASKMQPVAIVYVVSDIFPALLRTWILWTVSDGRTPPVYSQNDIC